MAYEGYIYSTSPTEIQGWVFDNALPDQPLMVEILDGDRVVDRFLADEQRPDLLAHGKGNGRHGFQYRQKQPATGRLKARLAGKRWTIQQSRAGVPDVPIPPRFERGLSHSLEFGLPIAIADQGFSQAATSADEGQIVDRLIRAYHRTLEDHPDRVSDRTDVWSEVGKHFHQEVIKLLRTRDVAGLTQYLRDAHAQGLTWGITQGPAATEALRHSPDARRLFVLEFIDQTVSLAEFLGLLDVESPEQHGQWGENLHMDPQVLIQRIGDHLKIPVVPPQMIGSAFGLRTADGILVGRDLFSLYAVLRLRDLARERGHERPSICEIGGGHGGVAYYANRLGFGIYTIVDLPLVSLLQGYFLLRALPGVKVRLYGEEEDPSTAIQLLPTFYFDHPSVRFNILFNQNGMPEMHPDYAKAYLGQARRKGPSLFLSINQESRGPQNASARQPVVRDLAREVGGYVPRYRFRHWLKTEYIEELFTINP